MMNTPARGTTVFIFVLYALQGFCTCDDLKCFRCFDAEDPQYCSETAVCGKNEICYTNKFEDHVGRIRYHLGCMENKACQFSNLATILGKRDATSQQCFECCSSNECNSHLCDKTYQTQGVHSQESTMTVTSSTTTPATTTTTSAAASTTPRGRWWHDTGHIQWRDCSYGNSWIAIHHLDISPKPVNIPGSYYLTLDADISQYIGVNIAMEILLEKEMLGRYTKVPCKDNFGTCYYDDPCSHCPATFTLFGLSCNCPIKPQKIHLERAPFTTGPLHGWLVFLSNGKYHIKIELTEKATRQQRACLEFNINIAT